MHSQRNGFGESIQTRNFIQGEFMKYSRFISMSLAMLVAGAATAGTPVWTFTPKTKTTISVPGNGNDRVEYVVTNQSRVTHKLAMRPIAGITQVTTEGGCANPFTLTYKQVCTLTLAVTGSALKGNVVGGPVVCQDGNPNQCYQPSAANSLKITKTADVYTVGGTVYGLTATGLILSLDNGNQLPINADGPYVFNDSFDTGDSYFVRVAQNPTGQTCNVSNRAGTITNASVTNVDVHCAVNTAQVPVNVSGLGVGQQVILTNEYIDDLTATANIQYNFPPQAVGSTYHVRVKTQPVDQTCTVNNAQGTVPVTGPVTPTVSVVCATNDFPVGGTVSGLTGTLGLTNDGEALTITQNGSFAFPNQAEGSTYNVVVSNQPTNQKCTVTNGAGTVNGPVTNVTIGCTTNATTIRASVYELLLSVTGRSGDGPQNLPSGKPRIITIKNIGSAPTTALSVSSTPVPPPNVATITNNCNGNKLNPGATCTITITPGPVASSSTDGNPCSEINTTRPLPTTVTVDASNTNTQSSKFFVLNYGCVAHGGFIYAMNDAPPPSASIGGRVVTQASMGNSIWSNNGSIYGISDNSTPTSPSPSTGKLDGQFACLGKYDGSCDSNNIIFSKHSFVYAAGFCSESIGGFHGWYLPAICQIGPSGGAGLVCNNPLIQNIQGSIPGKFVGNFWSSTQASSSPSTLAWVSVLVANPQPNPLPPAQAQSKGNTNKVLCSRTFI